MAHQRPKLERYGDTLFVVLRPARYLRRDRRGRVRRGPRVRRSRLRDHRAAQRGPRLHTSAAPPREPTRPAAAGPEAVLYAILDRVVDGYYPVVAGVGNDIDEIETEVFSGDAKVSRRIYELSREVTEFQRSTRPLSEILAALSAGFAKYHIDDELQRYLRDSPSRRSASGSTSSGSCCTTCSPSTPRSSPSNRTKRWKNLAEAANAQNEEVKKISAWAAILFAPTLIGTIYGMNFENMPELEWVHGYPLG